MRALRNLALPLLVSLAVPTLIRAEDVDPKDYCAAHANEPLCFCLQSPSDPKCLKFLGANPAFSSHSGNVGGTGYGGQQPAQQQPINRTESPTEYGIPTFYALFVHYGSQSPVNADVSQLISRLRNVGFRVLGTDRERDVQGGPGVDFFRDEDEAAAKKIAELVNDWRGTPTIKARRQKVKNPPGFIGVWLF